jgi:GNAT superfamily N-acetyltransferase
MNDFFDLNIEPLNTNHDRSNFQCGVDALDMYLKKQARQDIKRHISRVFVARKSMTPKNVVGYYTLSSLSIDFKELPEKLSKKLPKHQIPAALIGRLAVSRNAQGHGVGRMLLADAIKRTLSISDEIAIYAMIVDAIDKKAQGFYEQFGFIHISDDSHRLFLPLKLRVRYGSIGLQTSA